MSAAVVFKGQLRARLAEIPQWEAERDDSVQLWRTCRAADPTHFTISAEQFRPAGRYRRISQEESHHLPAYAAVGVHTCDDLLTRIAALVEAESFTLQVRFRRDDLLVQVEPGLWQACFDAEGLTSVTPNRFDSICRTCLHESFPGWVEGISRQ